MAKRDVIPRWVAVNRTVRCFEQYNVYNDHNVMHGFKCRGTDRVTEGREGRRCSLPVGKGCAPLRKCVIFVGGNMHFLCFIHIDYDLKRFSCDITNENQ